MGNTYTESQKKAIYKYLHNTDEIKIRVPKGTKAVYKEHADSMNESLHEFLCRAITTQIDIDNLDKKA